MLWWGGVGESRPIVDFYYALKGEGGGGGVAKRRYPGIQDTGHFWKKTGHFQIIAAKLSIFCKKKGYNTVDF